MMSRLAVMLLAGLALSSSNAIANGSTTQVMPLSGMGVAGEAPVHWDFRLDTGRGGGAWSKILVPAQWEQQGFGTYYYGTQGRGKPDTDPVIPKEVGTYRRSFDLPKEWQGREVHLVFEAAMTDTSVSINGQSAGATHQGGFYRFSFDITRLLKAGSNEIEVQVAKESANGSVNHAERRGDYWTFGGIYRPVWLEARPRHHIAWTAIDARADGTFAAQLHFDEPVPRNTHAAAQILDARGQPVGEPFRVLASRKDQVEVRGSIASALQWTAETPHLYSVRFTLEQGSKRLHELTERFGFRTVEVRENDGVYLNGRKIVLKGVNRHSFRPASGRTLTREENYADARLIKSMNMNAVRMSHYPPDPAFLEACDELGLYVLDELAGWQGSYDTPTGARLIGQIVRRDVNHPSILFWDNGNEGGWNTDNDGEFAKWDPQKRKVLHPWAVHDGINTDHYENYESTKKLSAGPQIFMPTEFLHGLYDGGIGAGFEDYWKVMGSSPTVAGGFFWAFADECVERTDQGRRIDCMGNAAPDGIVGPNHEKEGSYYTVRDIWSPVQARDLAHSNGVLSMVIRNEYDFASLSSLNFAWQLRELPDFGSRDNGRVLSEGTVRGPDIGPRQEQSWSLPVPAAPLAGGVIELTAFNSHHPVRTWTLSLTGRETVREPARIRREKQELSVSAGDYTLRFHPDGTLVSLRQGSREIVLAGPSAHAWIRDQRGFRQISMPGKLRKLELAPRDDASALARVSYVGGTLKSVLWRIDAGQLSMSYELESSGNADIFGIHFTGDRAGIHSKRWVGAGPYRVWKNRRAGPVFGLHEVPYNDPVPGESFDYPEFPGFFENWRWLELRQSQGSVWFGNRSDIPFFGLHRPQAGKQPVLELPDLGWSFLHAIPPIGTKFTLADVLGPQSQPTTLEGLIRGEVVIALTPP